MTRKISAHLDQNILCGGKIYKNTDKQFVTDRIAMVTGTSSGIGEALASKLLSDNWNVVGIARSPVAGRDLDTNTSKATWVIPIVWWAP